VHAIGTRIENHTLSRPSAVPFSSATAAALFASASSGFSLKRPGDTPNGVRPMSRAVRAISPRMTLS
jgi:hypothetical protein